MPTLKELQQQHPVGTKFRLPEHGAGFAIYFNGLEWLNYCGYPHCLNKQDAHKHTWEVYQEPKKHEVWINIYIECISSCGYHSKEDADKGAGRDRIACIKVEFTEGEGL